MTELQNSTEIHKNDHTSPLLSRLATIPISGMSTSLISQTGNGGPTCPPSKSPKMEVVMGPHVSVEP